MKKRHFDAYGDLARAESPLTVQSGRYPAQAEAERLILADIEPKLVLEPHHSLLEIGCGPGNLLIPLSFRVARAHGIDHPDVVARAQARFKDPRVQFQGAFFPEVAVAGPFDRVLAYSVIHCLPDWPTLLRFMDAAVDLLGSPGRLLIGDIANSDRKQRFLQSEAGKTLDEAWKRGMAGVQNPFAAFGDAGSIGSLDDKLIISLLERYRGRGFHAYVLPQRPDLPFGHTREDILIEKL